MTIEFELTADLQAHEPPEERAAARDLVAMLVSRRATGEISHHAFGDLPDLLLPGDLVVVNTSATLPAAVGLSGGLAVHFSTPLPDGDWLVELRTADGTATAPFPRVCGAAAGSARRRRPDPDRAIHPAAVARQAVHRGGAVPAPPGRSDQVLICRPVVVDRGVPDGVRRTAGQRRDAQRQQAVYTGDRDPPGHQGHRDRAGSPAHRRLVPGGPRGPLPGALRRAARHCAAGQPDQAARRPGDRGGHYGGPGARDRGVPPPAPRDASAAGRACRHAGEPARVVDGLLTGLHEPRSSICGCSPRSPGPSCSRLLRGGHRAWLSLARVRRPAPAAALIAVPHGSRAVEPSGGRSG